MGQRTSLQDLSNIAGLWIRVDGNNSRANGMVVEISGKDGTIVNAARTSLKKGDLKWKDIGAAGKNQFRHSELGSNYRYYDARMNWNGGDTLFVSVGASGRGNQQAWIRKAGQSKVAPLKPASSNVSFETIEYTGVEQPPVFTYGFQGEAILLNANRTYLANSRVPEELKQVLFSYLQKGYLIQDIEFNPSGGWIIASDKQLFVRNVGGTFLEKASKVYEKGGYIADVEFNPENWKSKRAFRFLDNNGELYSDEQASLSFDRKEEIQVVPGQTEQVSEKQSPLKGSRIKYTFRYDWLVVYESNDRGIPGMALDLYGHGDLEFWVSHGGITARLDRMADFSSGTDDRFKGEVFNIERDNTVSLKSGEGISLAQNEVVITIDLQEDFNGISLNEFEAGSYLDLELRMVESDPHPTPLRVINPDQDDDRFPVIKKRLYLNEADILPYSSVNEVRRASSQSAGSATILETRYRDDKIGVSYSLIREILED